MKTIDPLKKKNKTLIFFLNYYLAPKILSFGVLFFFEFKIIFLFS